MFQQGMEENHHHLREASIKVRKTEYKDIIKKRAIASVKEKRRQLQQLIRDPFSNCNDEDLALHDEYIKACKIELERMLSEEKGSMSDEEYFDLLVQLGNEIENEWKEEEQEYLKQFEEEETLEAEDLQQLIEFYEKSVYLCPLCKKNYLLETKHSLFCKCGLRVPTSSNGLSVKYISQQLIDCYGDHGKECDKVPQVVVETRAGMDFVSLRCDHCDFLEIII